MRFRAFKWCVYGLLALNLGLFLLYETPVEALDSLGWLVLLGVLERETSTLGRPRSGRETAALRAAQGAGYAVVVVAWAGYAREGMWPDFANASLWLGVVLALAFDVRFPPDGAARLRAHRSRQAARGALYAGLVALALWWTAAGELLNGFDAALWLLCFFAVEGNILRHESAEPAPAQMMTEADKTGRAAAAPPTPVRIVGPAAEPDLTTRRPPPGGLVRTPSPDTETRSGRP